MMEDAVLTDAPSAHHLAITDPMFREYRLAELLSTRLCHDLIGPVGAVNNGAEFLREEGGNLQGQVIDLIESSAKDAVARLQFYRVAYGKVNDIGEAGLSDLKKITESFFRNTKVVLDWAEHSTESSGVPVSRRMGKLLINLIILASGALIRGGTLSVRVTHEGDEDILSVSVEGRSARLDEELLDALKGNVNPSELTPKSVQAYISGIIAQTLNVDVRVEHGEDRVAISVRRVRPQEA